MIWTLSIPNNQLKFGRLLGYAWHLYSDMSVGVVGYDFDYDNGSYLCGEDWLDELKYEWFGTCAKPGFQLRLLRSPPKLFETFGMFWEESGSEDLITH